MAKWPYTTQRWQRLRKYKLQLNPLCEACLQLGYIEPATTVDHRTPINRGGEPYPEIDKLASLCERCHNMKTRCEQLGEDYMRKGCDVFGRPLDPDHSWNSMACDLPLEKRDTYLQRSRRSCSSRSIIA